MSWASHSEVLDSGTIEERLELIEAALARIEIALAGVTTFVGGMQQAIESHPLARNLLGR